MSPAKNVALSILLLAALIFASSIIVFSINTPKMNCNCSEPQATERLQTTCLQVLIAAKAAFLWGSEQLQNSMNVVTDKVDASNMSVTNVSSSTEELAASMEEIAATIQEMANHSTNVLEQAMGISEEANQGVAVVNDLQLRV